MIDQQNINPPHGGQSYQPTPEYVVLRRTQYPDIMEFIDAFYWLQRGRPEVMESYLTKIDAIKNDFPKDQTLGE
jgi:hypothetical protein